ncbi:MAG TPA: hypothetical protein PL045_06470, partial [Chitinophagaceae bacterium]|nr:hypothetical protein [Chitinophagaceae bacterium]
FPHDKNFWDSLSLIREKLTLNLIYWKEIVQQNKDTRRQVLSEPLYQKVRTAFKKVIQKNNYDLILKPGAIQFTNNIDNLFILVAKELNLTSLPDQLQRLGNFFGR